MMTVKDTKMMLKVLSANYADFYKGTSEEDVLQLWSVTFEKDDAELVAKGVMNCINTTGFRPTIYDIRVRMAKSKIKGQLTPTEAFQQISKAVNKVFDRQSAADEYNRLDPIVRKVVGFPEQLISWSRVSEEAFQTVIMSAIRESYKEFAKRELDYHTMPDQIKNGEDWMVATPEQVALPEPEVQKSIEDVIREANESSAAHGMQMTPELKEKHARRIDDFQKPLTDEEKKKITDK